MRVKMGAWSGRRRRQRSTSAGDEANGRRETQAPWAVFTAATADGACIDDSGARRR